MVPSLKRTFRPIGCEPLQGGKGDPRARFRGRGSGASAVLSPPRTALIVAAQLQSRERLLAPPVSAPLRLAYDRRLRSMLALSSGSKFGSIVMRRRVLVFVALMTPRERSIARWMSAQAAKKRLS